MQNQFRPTLKLAFPLILGNFTQLAFGLIDSAMVGAIDHVQLAASSLVVNAIAIPQVLGSGLTMAVSPLVAISRGQNDPAKTSAILFNGFLLCALVGLTLALSIVFGNGILLHLNQDPVVATLAVPYFKLMGWSLLPMMIFLSMKQFSDGLEYTKTGMTISVSALALNAFLCWVFIYGNLGAPRMELPGAGLATLITRICQMLAMYLVISRHKLFTIYMNARQEAWKRSTPVLKDLLNIGVPASLQYFMEAGAFSVSGIMVGWLGAETQAAHQIALNCASATFMAALGLSVAASIRISGAFGRKDFVMIRTIGKTALRGGMLYGLCCAVLLVLLRNVLPLLFNHEPIVVARAATLMVFAAFFQVSDVSQAIGVGLLRGIKDMRKPTLYVLIAYWIIGIPVGYLLCFTFNLGAKGIWLGFVAGLTASSLLLNQRFFFKTKLRAT